MAEVVTAKLKVRHIPTKAVEASRNDLEPLDNGEVIADELPKPKPGIGSRR